MPSNSEIDDLPTRIAQRLLLPLPGRTAARTMEPELGYGRYFGPVPADARPAAVVALLQMVNGQWHLPLTMRPEALSNHGGQISLPGGLIEPGESTDDAALRELEEELGVPRFGAMLLGQLSPIFLYGTNFSISPWVAAMRGPVKFLPSAAEVDRILQAPLMHFLEPSNRGRHIERRGSICFTAPHFDWQGNHIWGATSMILAELAAVVGDVVRSN
jgi:8-oxo-dGTP pyrophosphatase MutT (NUDIX family)